MTWTPTFIGIGAEKSATTWAWTVLNEHTDVCMSQPKELNYFNLDENYSRGSSWYRRHFARPAAITGEISPLYMDDSRVAERLSSDYPNVRLLVMLRNPFDRTMSHLFHDASVLYGKVADLTAGDLQRLAERDEKYIRRSCYATALRPFFERFAAEQIGVFYFDDVRHDGLNTARQIYEFVGADPRYVPAAYGEKVNESQDLRPFAGAVMAASRAARRLPVTRPLMQWIYRKTTLRERVIRWVMVNKGRPQIRFSDVFGAEHNALLTEEIRQLNSMLRQEVPRDWSETVNAQSLRAA